MSKLKSLGIIIFTISVCFALNSVQGNPPQADQTQDNNKGKMILASALVPGWGQTILKNNLKGEIMLWVDGAIWLAYGGYTWYGNSQNRDAKIFARNNAQANLGIKSDKYFRALERYNNSSIYNDDIRREARGRFPDDPSAQDNYIIQNGYFNDSTWNWNADSLRFVYWEKRKSARAAFTKAGFVLGGALLNRVVSMIDCAFFTPDKRNKIGIVPNLDEPGIGLIYRF